jgi:hypothetical protein
MTAEELPHVKEIEHFIGQKITRLKLENFPYIYSAIFNEETVEAALRGAKGVRTHRGMSFGSRRRRCASADGRPARIQEMGASTSPSGRGPNAWLPEDKAPATNPSDRPRIQTPIAIKNRKYPKELRCVLDRGILQSLFGPLVGLKESCVESEGMTVVFLGHDNCERSVESPWSARGLIAILENKPGGYQRIVLARHGDKRVKGCYEHESLDRCLRRAATSQSDARLGTRPGELSPA